MFCSKCGKQIEKDVKFCGHCGQPIHESVQNTEIKSTKNNKINIEKIKKDLRNTGNSVWAIGWTTLCINFVIYILSIFYKNFADFGLSAPSLSGTFVMMVASIVFIILGARIKKLEDVNIKLYLQILLVLSLVIFILLLATGGKIGILLVLILIYLGSSLISVNKALKNSDFLSTLISPKYKIDKKGWIIYSASALVLASIFFGIDILNNKKNEVSVQNNTINTENANVEVNNAPSPAIANIESSSTVNVQASTVTSKTDEINKLVSDAMATSAFPQQIDEITSLVSITAEPSAIRYNYVISDSSSGFDTMTLKKNIASGVCQKPNLTNLLKKGIDMQYSYTFKDSQSHSLIIITKDDCPIN